MHNTNKNQAEAAYGIIASKANTNSITQALSGAAGFPFTIAADVAVIPTIYMPLWNDIRRVYGYDPMDSVALGNIVGKILPEVLADLAMDKVLGNVPILGIYFNAICAKAMTWRLGMLFTFLSSRGSTIPEECIQKAMLLIRKSFPQNDMFKFQTPDKARFIKLITSVSSISEVEMNARLDRAIEFLAD